MAHCPNSPDALLISGQPQTESDVLALEYDPGNGVQDLLDCDGRPTIGIA